MPGTWRTGRPITGVDWPRRRTRAANLLLLPEDEVALQAALTEERAGLKIVDGTAPWPAKTEPPVRDSVLEVGTLATLWDPEVLPALPRLRRGDTPNKGMQAGKVVQWKRGGLSADDVLGPGMWTAVLKDGQDPALVAFIDSMWRVLLRFTTDYLVRWIPSTGVEQRAWGFHTGPHAFAAARNGEITLESGFGRLYPPSQDKARGAHW